MRTNGRFSSANLVTLFPKFHLGMPVRRSFTSAATGAKCNFAEMRIQKWNLGTTRNLGTRRTKRVHDAIVARASTAAVAQCFPPAMRVVSADAWQAGSPRCGRRDARAARETSAVPFG